MLGIDVIQFALETRVEHVAYQRGADRIGRFRSPNDGNRAGFEKVGEIVFFVVHGELGLCGLCTAIYKVVPTSRYRLK